MSQRKIRLIGAHPVHPGRGEPSRIEFSMELQYLKDGPIESIELTEDEALRHAERLLNAVNIIRRSLPHD